MVTLLRKKGNIEINLPRSWEIIQTNCSHSQALVLRGLHYHLGQVDYWFAPRGMIRVALVDLRRSSPTRGVSQTLEIGEDNPMGIFIPIGIAHGFTSSAPAAFSAAIPEAPGNRACHRAYLSHGPRAIWQDTEKHLCPIICVRLPRLPCGRYRCVLGLLHLSHGLTVRDREREYGQIWNWEGQGPYLLLLHRLYEAEQAVQ